MNKLLSKQFLDEVIMNPVLPVYLAQSEAAMLGKIFSINHVYDVIKATALQPAVSFHEKPAFLVDTALECIEDAVKYFDNLLLQIPEKMEILVPEAKEQVKLTAEPRFHLCFAADAHLNNMYSYKQKEAELERVVDMWARPRTVIAGDDLDINHAGILIPMNTENPLAFLEAPVYEFIRYCISGKTDSNMQSKWKCSEKQIRDFNRITAEAEHSEHNLAANLSLLWLNDYVHRKMPGLAGDLDDYARSKGIDLTLYDSCKKNPQKRIEEELIIYSLWGT